jgi:hypothetical protein
LQDLWSEALIPPIENLELGEHLNLLEKRDQTAVTRPSMDNRTAVEQDERDVIFS